MKSNLKLSKGFRCTLRAKFITIFTLLIAVISAFIFFYFPLKLERQVLKYTADKAQGISDMTALNISSFLFSGDKRNIGAVFESVKQDEDIVYLVVLNERGEVFSAFNHERAVDLNFKSPAGRKPIPGEMPVYRVMSPIVHNKRQIGQLFLGMSLESIQSQIARSKKTTMLVSLTVFVLGMLAVFFISTIIIQPLIKVVRAIKQVSEGDLSKRLSFSSHDETGNLAESFNAMVANLEAYAIKMEELTNTLETKVAERTEKLQSEINERQSAQEALKKNEEKYRRLVDNSLVGIYITQEHNFKFCNRGFVRIFGYRTEAEILQKQIGKMVTAESWELLRKVELLDHLEKGETTSYELKGIRKDGTIFDIEVFIDHIIYQDKPAVQGILIDITERKRAEEEQRRLEDQLLHAQKMESIGRLAGGIAHDFNNVLSVIMGYTELTLNKIREDNFIKANLSRVLTASNRAKDMIKQILAFSRKAEKEREPVLLRDVVGEALELMRSVLPTTIRIQQSIGEKLHPVMANQTEIHQVIINLCINAGHAMREKGGELKVNLKEIDLESPIGAGNLKPGRYQQLTVSDTGHGISPEIINRIFEPYFTTKKEGEGTGMGLSVAHGIVSGYGGDITVYSQPDKGTTFHIFLPVEKEKEQEVKIEQPEPIRGGKETILLVDDEQSLTELVKEMLESHGYNVIARNDSIEALELFSENPGDYDLIISDQTMPEMSGVQLAAGIKKISAHIPIIVCSGFSESINEDNYESMGIDAFLMKPFIERDLAILIRQVLDK